MSLFDFNRSGFRSWLDHGMVMPTSPNTTAPLKKQQVIARAKNIFVAFIIGINVCTTAQAVSLPNQIASVCSLAPEPSYLVKKALLDTLKSIASLGDNWQGQDAPAPSKQAITAAEQIVPSLPNTIAGASAGVDGDGNVYFKLQNGEKLAYLTVEPTTMHLLVIAPGEKNVYLDNVKFQPRELPSKIRRTLEQKMVG